MSVFMSSFMLERLLPPTLSLVREYSGASHPLNHSLVSQHPIGDMAVDRFLGHLRQSKMMVFFWHVLPVFSCLPLCSEFSAMSPLSSLFFSFFSRFGKVRCGEVWLGLVRSGQVR